MYKEAPGCHSVHRILQHGEHWSPGPGVRYLRGSDDAQFPVGANHADLRTEISDRRREIEVVNEQRRSNQAGLLRTSTRTTLNQGGFLRATLDRR